MSFRSTEFIDDSVRDNMATNKMEIAEGGWAIGQIADMERWYRQLTGAGGPLSGGQRFSVTGYSLGGNLATAFNFLHEREGRIAATYTFNGAGVGDVIPPKLLRTVVDEFESRRSNASSVFAGTLAQGLYAQLRTRYSGGSLATMPHVAEIQADITELQRNDVAGAFPVIDAASRDLLIAALTRIKDIVDEAGRISGFTSGDQ